MSADKAVCPGIKLVFTCRTGETHEWNLGRGPVIVAALAVLVFAAGAWRHHRRHRYYEALAAQGDADVIVPLDVRDPSALVMGPSAGRGGMCPCPTIIKP